MRSRIFFGVVAVIVLLIFLVRCGSSPTMQSGVGNETRSTFPPSGKFDFNPPLMLPDECKHIRVGDSVDRAIDECKEYQKNINALESETQRWMSKSDEEKMDDVELIRKMNDNYKRDP